jgi:restriction system protein
MAVPDFQSIMLPLLKALSDGKEHYTRDVFDAVADIFKMTVEERKERLPSGNIVYENRAGWARTYLKKAGLVEYTGKGSLKITRRGLEVLKENPPKVTVKFLKRFPEFNEFVGRKKKDRSQVVDVSDKETPEESIAHGYRKMRENLAQDLLEQIRRCSPSFFEKLVVDLLVKMGYGGSINDAGKAIGRSGDEGIDGIIKEDRLDLVLIQCTYRQKGGKTQ